MDEGLSAFEFQVRLIAALGQFAGEMPAGFLSQKEFFLIKLEDISENLAALKLARLRAAEGSLLRRLEKGPLADGDLTDFKGAIDKLLSSRDYDYVCAALAGSRELLKKRLAEVKPLSIADEEKKAPGAPREQAADRLVSEAYRRLRFDELEREALRAGGYAAADLFLGTARGRVAEYCVLYRVPIHADDTLTTFSLSSIDAVAGACFRLLARLRAGGR